MISKSDLERLIRSGDPKTLAKVNQYLDLQQAEEARTSFRQFVKVFWPIVSTTPLRGGWYLDCLCDHLQALPELKRLLVNVCPRHAKSTLCAVLFPAWFLLNQPSTKFLASSYSLQLSLRDSIACRAVIESPQYQRWYGHLFRLRADQNTKGRFHTSEGGYRLATSVSSSNTGEGAEIAILDDLNNVANVHSPQERQGVIDWFTRVMSTRMNPGGLDCKVVIQQRCHEEDISGYILSNADNWVHLCLPWQYDPKRKTITPIWSDPRTEPDEPLSDLLAPEKVKEVKSGTGLGPTGFATQYNQRPAPAEGNVFQAKWFGRYTETPDAYLLEKTKVPKALCRCFITTDLAVSLKASADYTVASTWVITPHNHLLLVDLWRDRVEGPDAIRQFKKLVERCKPDAIWVEDVAYQKIMLQLLRQQGLPVRPLQHMGLDKKSRAQRAIVKAECGQIWLPQHAAWIDDWLAEVTTFPNATFDDCLDCLAWAGGVAANYPTRDLPPDETPEDKQQREQREQEERRNKFLWAD